MKPFDPVGLDRDDWKDISYWGGYSKGRGGGFLTAQQEQYDLYAQAGFRAGQGNLSAFGMLKALEKSKGEEE